MRFIIPAVLLVNIAGLLASRGDATALLIWAFFGQVGFVVTGFASEKSAWPFEKPDVRWPFSAVGLVSFVSVGLSWQQDILSIWPFIAYGAAFVAIGFLAAWRGWKP